MSPQRRHPSIRSINRHFSKLSSSSSSSFNPSSTISGHSSILFLLFSIICFSIVSSTQKFDVCIGLSELDRRRPSDFLHEGIEIDLSTGVLDGMLSDSRGKYCELSLRLNKSHGERTEVSYVRHGLLNEDNCFDVVYEERGNR